MRREIGEQDFKGLSGRDIVDRVNDHAVILAHDLLLGLINDESFEQGRETYMVLCEGWRMPGRARRIFVS